MLKIFLGILLSLIIHLPAQAQDSTGVQSFQASKDEWRRKADKNVVLSEITDKVGKTALKNITESEQVFCYQVDSASPSYNGYTIDGYAIKAFCGIINKEIKDMIVAELFMNKDNINFDKNEDCVIKPKIMLRFVRGIDNTDVLLSSPCYSIVVYYAGKIHPFNASPADAIINAIVDPLQRNRAEFVSPALMNQLLPIGVAQTTEQKALLSQSKSKENAPVKSWGEEKAPTKPRRGWNSLNLNM